jgi:hypothetical protein
MFMNRQNAVMATLSLVLLTACGGGGDGVRYSEADQTAALEACAEQLQIPLFTQYLPSEGRPGTIFAVNANGVTLAEGRSLNQCKQQTVAANYTPVYP